MIPIQTVLALLTLLMLMGCSQVAPPKPYHDRIAQGQAKASPSPTQNKVDNGQGQGQEQGGTQKPTGNGPNPTVNSLNPKCEEPSELVVDTADPQLITLKISGQDACRLFHATEIALKYEASQFGLGDASAGEATIPSKTGQQYRCEGTLVGQYECRIKLSRTDGSIASLTDAKVAPAKARMKIPTQLKGKYLQFDGNPDGKTNFFQVVLVGAEGKTFHDAFSVGEIEGRKKGQLINCLRDLKKGTEPAAYNCMMWGFLNAGNFMIIK